MIVTNEKRKKIDELYAQLQDLKEGKKVLENAMHRCFYNKDQYHNLFAKLEKQIQKINVVKKELAKEKLNYEKSRKNI